MAVAELTAQNKSQIERIDELQKRINALETEKAEMRRLENEKIKAMAEGSNTTVNVDSNKK